MYVGLKSGVHRSECNGNNLVSNTEKIWDAPILDLTASKSYTTMALAAGSDGLFQLKIHPLKSNEQKQTPTNISKENCTYCDWSYCNIFATSYSSSSFFAAFKKEKDPKNSKKKIRAFDKIITEDKIFNKSGFSWGIHDKIYTWQDNRTIEAIRYSSKKDGSPIFTSIGNINLSEDYGEMISAKAASFGTILEFEESIVVVRSNEEIFFIPGEPVNWRVFSNSKNYTNQLHIVYEDRLEIYSFYNDYFVDQRAKIFGINMFD